MKKKVFSLMMTLLLAFIGVARAEIVEIGVGGTTTNAYVPTYNLYNYSLTQQIYTADEIGTAGTINSIAFYCSSTGATRTLDLYMVNTTKSTFAGSTDWITVTAADKVFTGSVTMEVGAWNTITLDTPFAYDGSSNLAVIVDDNTGSWTSSAYYYVFDATGMTLRVYSDPTNYDPMAPTSYSGTVMNVKNQIQLDITPGGGGAGAPYEAQIGEGTSTTGYFPFYTLYNYSISENLFLASELTEAGVQPGQVTSLSWYATNETGYAQQGISIWMANVNDEVLTTNSHVTTDMTLVYTGSMTPAVGWNEFPCNAGTFTWDGVSNVLIFCQRNNGAWNSTISWQAGTTPFVSMAYRYQDTQAYDVTISNIMYTSTTRSNIIIKGVGNSGGGGGGVQNVLFAMQDGEDVETVVVGTRPNGCWMEPFTFQLRNDGPATTVNLIDFTPQDYFTVVTEMPFGMAHNEIVDVQLTTGTSTITEWQMVALYGTGRTARVWNITAEPYDPQTPDVWELACEEATTFPFVEIPADAHHTTLHNDYTLPFPEIPEGEDAVYKLVFAQDQMLNAAVTYGDNGKVALYTEDFYGQGGPMADNNYTGISLNGGGASGAPFEAQIGEGTSTSTYFPFHTLWNYSMGENLYLASELAEAGVTTAPMTSLSWYVSSMSCTTPQNNISIWMANVSDAELTSTSHTTAGMTLVYTGDNVLPTAGEWNEFVFNQGTFAWDGSSNVLILCTRNNGSWQGSISWQTHNPGFTAMCYHYSDTNGGYDVANTPYTGMYTSATNRANIIFKSNGGRSEAARETVEIGTGTNTYYYYPVNMYFNYSLTEQIYTADEIGTAGTINSIGFYYDYTNAFSMDNVTLYMKNVERDAFANNLDMEPLALSDIVWTGTLSATGPGWVTINLDTPFYYDGTSNLLVAGFDGTQGYPGSAYKFRTTPCDGYKGIHWYSDSYTPDPYNTAGGFSGSKSYTQYRSNIQLDITPGGGGGQGGIFVNYSAGPVITDLPVRPGTYYLVASSTTHDFEVTINAENMPCPQIDAEGFAFNPTPADNEDEVEPGSVTLRWMIPSYATGWRLIFGTTYHPEVGHPQTIIYPEDGSFTTALANSFTVRNLWNNTNYFWRVEFNNDGCPDGVTSPVWGFTTHLNIPQNLTAVDYTVFDDEPIVLNWNAVVDRTYRQYNVYRDGELIGHTTVNNISNTTYTDGPLAYNMTGYTYYVTAVYDEGESAPSDPVTVKVSGRGNVDGHVYEQDGITGIANATVTMVGNDEFGDSHTYTFQTNYQGYYSGAVYAGSYNGSASCNGYFTVTEPVQGNPIDITYDQTTSPIDYILDETFDPVCQVIAEYYPDSLDPTSPYVKVYWGCGLPGSEIVEPFETGDFSLFDWNITGSYPWEVTTTHPYEGEYCMRSTNYNVASSTSSIDVTVDIPADGIMSFFGYISSENNWDYGYFYIDGVQKGSYTGAGNSWGEKKFDITEGTHNFKWEYTKDGSVNSNEDRFYVDYITFYKQPEPAQPGWHTYCESEFNNAVGSSLTSTPSWAYEYPTSFLHSNYAGWQITKVSLFSDNMYSAVGGNYTCRIYVGGTQPAAGTMVSTLTVDVPSNLNAWVDWDLTTPVNVTGNEPIWVVWTANTTVSSWPAGCCGDLNDYGTWWDGGNGWEHLTYGTWTMRHWFTNRSGRSVVLSTASAQKEVVFDNPIKSSLRSFVKGDNSNNAVCANANAERIAGNSATRAFSHYRVYRTNCYNDGPYTEENTMILSCELTDTIYIDTYWADPEVTPPGVYKWGVGVVYAGNRGEQVESEITWSEPVTVNPTQPDMANRDQTFDFENGAIPTGWTNDATYPWTVVNNAYAGYNGTYCIKSGNGGVANSTSSISTSVNYSTDGTVSFLGGFWGEGSNDSYDWDKCRFYIDGTIMIDYGAHQMWENVSFDVTSGNHTFTWTYKKDGSVNPTGDAFFVDDVTFSYGGGGNNGGNGGNEPIQEPRESEIVWSNCLDKDMYLDGVTVTVLLNSADSPEGTTVSFTNTNEYEQQTFGGYDLTLDESGFYAFESFRRGEYNISVRHDGYEPIDETRLIWTNEDLRYVMIEILYGVENIYVSRTGWAMWEDSHNNPGGGGGGGQGNGDTFNENFDSGIPAGWTTLDVDGDGLTWVSSMNPGVYHNSGVNLEGTGHNSSPHYVISGSYANQTGQALHPDNYLVSPQVNLVSGSTFSFWACAQDASWAAEHFGVAISSNGTSDWTMVSEWTMTAKSGGDVMSIGRNGETRAQGNWYNYTVDLSAYAGQKYIGIRHFNCTDQFILNVDDISLTNGAKNADEMQHFEYYKVMCTSIDGVPIYNHNTVHPFCQLSTNEPYNAPLVEGEHYLCKVASVYSTGMSAWSTPVEWEYEPCDHWGPVDEVTVSTTAEGNLIEWVFEHGYNPYGGETPGPGPQPGAGDWYYYDNGINADAIGLTSGGSFYWGVMFPAGSFTGNMVTKVSMYDYSAHSGNILVYQGGTTAPGTLMGQQAYTCTGAEDFVEWEFASPVTIDPSQNLWIVMNNNNGQYVASCCDNTGDANGRWISLDGSDWMDLYLDAGLNYTWMIRAYVASGAKGEYISSNGNGSQYANEGEIYRQYSEDGVLLNFHAIKDIYFRSYLLYTLSNNQNFTMIDEDQYGLFIINPAYEMDNFMEEFEDFYTNAETDFSLLSKVDVTNLMSVWKSSVESFDYLSIMMDVNTAGLRADNDHCLSSMPFCTSEVMEFEAAYQGGATGEPGPDYGCLSSQPYPSWYHMRIHTAGQFVIHMESHDASGQGHDIDYCIWGPFDDPYEPCVDDLTCDKLVDCSYSAASVEDVYLGYPIAQHDHGTTSLADGNCVVANNNPPHVPEVGEYYILVITNYSQQQQTISFTKTEGEGETDCNIVTNPDVLGFLITQDGEYLAFAGPDDREYTDLGEFGDHEYCVRPIYPGEMVLPDHNFGWSMGCPVCEFGPSGQCAAGAPIHGEPIHETDQVKIWWGDENPGPGPGGCEGDEFSVNFDDSQIPAGWTTHDEDGDGYNWVLGSQCGGIYLATGGSLAGAGHNSSADLICSGSYSNATGQAITPDNWLITPTVTLCEGSTFSFWACGQDASYVAEHFGVAVSEDNGNSFTMVQEWTMTAKGDGNMSVGRDGNVRAQGSWHQYTVNLGDYAGEGRKIAIRHFNCTDMFILDVDDIELTAGAKNRAGIVSYNVYRSTENANYTLIGNVPAVAGQNYYEYIDTPATAGTYYYQVTAVYDGCESQPALAYDDPTHDFVVVGVDNVGENNGMAIYPNPTKGNVTIMANGMRHITVVSTLGQVLFDADVNTDTYILNMAQFTAGMYTVRVTTENGVSVNRITVVR